MRVFIVLLVASLALFGACQRAQEQPPPPEAAPPPKPSFEVAAKTYPAKTVASVTVAGAEVLVDSILPEGVTWVFELTIPKGIQEISAWATEMEYNTAGPPMAVFPDDPEVVPPADTRVEVQWEMVPPTEGKLEGTERIEIKELGDMTVAAGMYQGGYDVPAYMKAIEKLMAWPAENGYQIVGPFTEVYLTNPEEVPPEDWKTELAVPVVPAAPPPEAEEAEGK